MPQSISLYIGTELGRYGFGCGHPFGPQRQDAFWDAIRGADLDAWVRLCDPTPASHQELERFHSPEYVALVKNKSQEGNGYLDSGDTPAFPGVYEAAAFVVGSVLHGIRAVMEKRTRRAFIPIAGLHHARPERAAGFCVFNDLGVAIATLKQEYGLTRIAYVDIDAHHGDGVYYPFESDPSVIFVDTHEDGRYLYPGSGFAHERGLNSGLGRKLNLPLWPGSSDTDFFTLWPQAEELLCAHRPQFIILQGGVDSLAGDPITHLEFSQRVHSFVTTRLITLAEEFCDGRIVVTGGGGYNLANIARGWSAILRSLLEVNA